MRRSVLIIEDSPSTASLARLALSELRCDIELATRADEALDLARGFEPAVITLDAYLMGISAVAFCVDLKDAAPSASMILLLDRGVHDATLPAAQGTLFKPLEPRRFADLVGRLLDAHGASAGA